MQPTMINVADCEWESVQRGRKFNIRRKPLPLDSGIPGVTVELSYMIVPDGYEVPRHRHNCDQIRYILDGTQSIGIRQDMEPGECGYFPEGVYYGPQAQQGDCECLLLQFQGPSGGRLLTSAELNATYQKLIAAGAIFENGVYKGRKADGTPQNKDSYTAIWEAHEGTKLEFPKPRYREPVMMLPDRFSWFADPTRAGVEIKHLGTFNEHHTSCALMRVSAGASLPASVQANGEIRYLIDGAFAYEGKQWSKGTYWYIPPGAAVGTAQSSSGATFFTIALPMLRMLGAKAA